MEFDPLGIYARVYRQRFSVNMTRTLLGINGMKVTVRGVVLT